MKKAVNVQLHISLNGMKDSEVEVMMDKTYNTSVHVSFQNPVNTPVKACEYPSILDKEIFDVHNSLLRRSP